MALGAQGGGYKMHQGQTSPRESPGSWAGTATSIEAGSLVGMVSQEKWDKTKALLKQLTEMPGKVPLPLQRLLEIWGFLMYVVRTYPWLIPYMKGMYLTVDSWQPGHAEDGFKMMDKEIQALECNCWGSCSLPCRREDEDGANGTPVVQAPEEGVALSTVEPVPR